ncbi:hypothetical protein F7U66_00455 [Vibrio parahaemolyticus]|nr:hypothetical protein [Vibrio parahaemolyticus]
MIQSSSSVFNRTRSNGNELSANTYNLLIGAVLCWGFYVNWLIVDNVPTETIMSINPYIFIAGYFISCIAGLIIYTKSDDALISFLGYNLVVAPFGLILNIAISQYEPDLVQEAIKVTGLTTGVMMLLGTLFPSFFKKISFGLTIALLVVIVIELFQLFVMGSTANWIDWVVALIFCGYIGVDWARANTIPKTANNAVDSAAALYMDIVILFLRILEIIGRNK